MKSTKFLLPIVLPYLCLALLLSAGSRVVAQTGLLLMPWSAQSGSAVSLSTAAPLDQLVVAGAAGKTLTVTDASGRQYVNVPVSPLVRFSVGGTAGIHTIRVTDAKGQPVQTMTFSVGAKTEISGDEKYNQMLALFYKGMCVYDSDGEGKVKWNGKTYSYFVHWGLDHCHTMKGMQYFSPAGSGFVDLCRDAQREDGMIWSFILLDDNAEYYKSCYGPFGYVQQIGDHYFVRQPTENHPEYLYVNTLWQAWKSSGDDQWMKNCLPSAARALDYAPNDPARWSKRFGLLKRVLTIDSWDFQVDDEYTPDLGLNNTMLVDPEKSKFGVFFGDNTGYALACDQLAEMYRYAGLESEAARFAQRANDIRSRLNALAWNGKFYRHFIDEDSVVKRNLGVDMDSQIAHSNAYSINRGLTYEQNVAIINTYMDLRNNLPVGSPGEWYAIYPPFERGFGSHNGKWQYMNGGLAGHAAGELARGAFENGYESYAVDILDRLFDLGKKYGNRIMFAYTGSVPPPPPPPVFKTIDLSRIANMDIATNGAKKSFPWLMESKAGNDVAKMPVGKQTFANIPFLIANPETNARRVGVAVSNREGFPARVSIPVNDTAACIYLLHAAGSLSQGSENVAATLVFEYADGSRNAQNIIRGKHLSGWWFPELKTPNSGVAWNGPNAMSTNVGTFWCAVNNPQPEKTVKSIRIQAVGEQEIYVVLGLTLADREPYHAPKIPSFGGPDNWAAGTATAALIEGLAGVKTITPAFGQAMLSPRWTATQADSIKAVVCFPASGGYVAYTYKINQAKSLIQMQVTGSGQLIRCHLLLPDKVRSIRSLMVDGKETPSTVSAVGPSAYLDFDLPVNGTMDIQIMY